MEQMSKLEMWLHFFSRHDEEKLKYAIEHNETIKEAEKQYQGILKEAIIEQNGNEHELERR